jgi:hypothetical protein
MQAPSAPAYSSIPALDSHDFQMSSTTPSLYDPNRLLAALPTHSESTSTSSAGNYTCCGLSLNDPYALLNHFEESHVYILEESGEFNSSDSPTPGSGSTASSQPSSPTMEAATLSPSILPYYADLRSLMASAIPTGLMSPTSLGIKPLTPELTAPSNPSIQMQLHGMPPSLLQYPSTPSGSAPAAKKEKLAIVAAADPLLVDESSVVSGPGIVHPGPPPPTQAPASFRKPFKGPTAHCSNSFKQANEIPSHAWTVLFPSFVSVVGSDFPMVNNPLNRDPALEGLYE